MFRTGFYRAPRDGEDWEDLREEYRRDEVSWWNEQADRVSRGEDPDDEWLDRRR